jgi:phage shock protein PspC (stress-responsive transcriptional regulator)
MAQLFRKLTSRKFLLALVGVVSGLAMAFGVEGTEITELISTVAGIVTALGSIVAYNVAEAKVDAAAASILVEGVELETVEVEE